MSAQFVCSQCPMILKKSERRQHISAQHLEYFPFGCTFCTKANLKLLATTEADMDLHISTCHNGNNLGIFFLKDQNKEVELNKMIEQCIRYSNHQAPSNDSKSELRQVFNLLDTGARTDNTSQNYPGLTQVKDEDGSDDDIIIIEDGIETAEMPNNTAGANLPEQTAQAIFKIETNESTARSVARPTTVSTLNHENSDAFFPKTKPTVSISIAPEPNNFAESYAELDYPRQSTSGKKREHHNNVSNDSFERSEKRRQMMTVQQLEFGSHYSHDVNQGSANGTNQDSVEDPTTSFQVTSSVPADSSQKQIITKLFIVISQGIVCYETNERHVLDETNDRCEHLYESLSDCVETLAGSELCRNGCEVVIQFYAGDTGIPFKYRYSGEKYKQEFTSLKQLKAFAQQLHSVAFLWADATVITHFGPFKKKSNKSPSQFDYCSELFSRERSILKCKRLDVTLVDNWSLSIVTNVVDRCDECELQLEESPGNVQLHEAFLQEIYERKLIPKIAFTLCIPDLENVNDFIEKLKARFRRAPQKCFKFELFTRSTEVRKFSLKFRDCILKAKTSKNYLESVIIEQRAIGS